MLFDKRSIQFLNTETGAAAFFLKHQITLLNSDKSIEEYNKFYIAKSDDEEIITIKARVIKPSGEIISVSKADIKDALDEDGKVKYNYFAFEGLEKGSLIEFLQYTKGSPDFSGVKIPVQGEVNKKHVELELIYPDHLEFQIYCMNGLPAFTKKEEKEDVKHVTMSLTLENLKGLEDEDWAAYDANIQKCYFKLSKNLGVQKGNFYTYTEVAKTIYEMMFTPLTKKEAKLVKAFISNNTKDGASTKEKIIAIENAAKKTITMVDGSVEGASNIEQLLSKKITNQQGMVKLMLNCLREMAIPFELVMTSNRFKDPFLEEFQGYNFLQEYLIFIPELNSYYSAELSSRLGFPPFNLNNNKGLFISEVMVSDFATSVGKIKYIKGLDYKQSIDEINAEFSFTEDLTSCKVKLKRINSGYKAMDIQPYFDLMDDKQKKEAKEEYLNYLDNTCTLEDIVFTNDRSEDFGVKPLIGEATVISTNFFENAGDKLLVKVGMLIGPQAQMYNKEARKLPVDAAYTRGYMRTITVNIPEGYTVKNLDDLKMNYQPDTKNNLLGFFSEYTVKGQQIIVTVKEWYNAYYFSVEDYPMYEKTMNAAADFNKIVLVLQKNK